MKLLLVLICTIPSKRWCALPFSPPLNVLPKITTASGSSAHYKFDGPATATTLFSSADEDPSRAASSSDGLRSLLPTPKKRTLRLDKLGRRIHDLTDDGTTQYSKRGGTGVASTNDAAPMTSDHDITADRTNSNDASVIESPSLSKMLNTDQKGEEVEDEKLPPPSLRSPKELAAIASSADFGKKISKSADLKALLPTQKMKFMRLDKFGRRVQRMEDDGTVNMQKEPSQEKQQDEVAAPSSQQQQVPIRSYRETKDGFRSDSNVESAAPDPPIIQQEGPIRESQSLSKILGTKEDRPSLYDAMLMGEGDESVNLKELLPSQKMKFMKLDKLGRRVQRMEDDGTVNMQKEPSTPPASSSGSSDNSASKSNKETHAVLDLGNKLESGAANYGSLKDLAPTKRATWTKLDFKGGSVVDERRMKKKEVRDDAASSDNCLGGGLRELLPKRATWTKLDFKGASVEDTRRTKNRNIPSSGSYNEGKYSNLRTLVPERTITWKKNQVLSSGSATAMSQMGVRGLREERQQAMRDDVIASATINSSASDDATSSEDDKEEKDLASDSSLTEIKAYTNLRDLLPERKVTWRNTRK